MAIIFEFIKSIWNNKLIRYILVGLIVLALSFFFYHRQINASYNRGKADQVLVYEKQQQELKDEYQRKLDAANANQIAANVELQKLKQDYADLQSKRKDKQKVQSDKVDNYAKTSNGTKRCIDAQWMQLFKDSLPE